MKYKEIESLVASGKMWVQTKHVGTRHRTKWIYDENGDVGRYILVPYEKFLHFATDGAGNLYKITKKDAAKLIAVAAVEKSFDTETPQA